MDGGCKCSASISTAPISSPPTRRWLRSGSIPTSPSNFRCSDRQDQAMPTTDEILAQMLVNSAGLAPGFVDEDENLRVRVFNSVAAVDVTIEGRLLELSGRV